MTLSRSAIVLRSSAARHSRRCAREFQFTITMSTAKPGASHHSPPSPLLPLAITAASYPASPSRFAAADRSGRHQASLARYHSTVRRKADFEGFLRAPAELARILPASMA